MSHSNTQHDLERVIDESITRTVPMPVLAGGVAAMVIGAACFVFGLVSNPVWAWGAFLVGLVFTLTLAQGGITFSIIATLTWARWSRPFKRIAESFGLFMPIAFVALIVFLIGGLKIYPWHPNTIVEGGPVDLHPHSDAVLFTSKPWWLSPGVFVIRQILIVAVLLAVDFLYLRAAMRPDLIAAKSRLGDRAPGWWGMFAGGARDLSSEVAASERTQAVLGVVLGWLYAFFVGQLGFDLLMSLSPMWYSNLFGGWFFASAFLMTMAFIGLFSMIARDWMGLKMWIRPKQTHDLGKLMLAFTMAYGYTTFAQILPIWYGNMPEETDYLLVRLDLPEWAWLTRTVAVLVFVTPFVMLTSRGLKKMRWPFAALCTIMLIGLFLDRTVLVMPSIYKGDTFPVVQFVVVSIGTWAMFMGAFVTVVTQALARMPVLPVTDPKLPEHPWDVHVHPVADMRHMGDTHGAS